MTVYLNTVIVLSKHKVQKLKFLLSKRYRPHDSYNLHSASKFKKCEPFVFHIIILTYIQGICSHCIISLIKYGLINFKAQMLDFMAACFCG
jgi:hypothetical protein